MTQSFHRPLVHTGYMLPVLYYQYHACWCPADLRSQRILISKWIWMTRMDVPSGPVHKSSLAQGMTWQWPVIPYHVTIKPQWVEPLYLDSLWGSVMSYGIWGLGQCRFGNGLLPNSTGNCEVSHDRCIHVHFALLYLSTKSVIYVLGASRGRTATPVGRGSHVELPCTGP